MERAGKHEVGADLAADLLGGQALAGQREQGFPCEHMHDRGLEVTELRGCVFSDGRAEVLRNAQSQLEGKNSQARQCVLWCS